MYKCNLFLWSKAEFSESLLQSSVSHDPSEIILLYVDLVLKKQFLPMLKTVVLHNIFVEIITHFFHNEKQQHLFKVDV